MFANHHFAKGPTETQRFFGILFVLSLLILPGHETEAAPIHDAARRGDLAGIRQLVETGAEVNARRLDGVTPLHWAAQEGHQDVVRYLLSQGGDPKLKNNAGWTPTHYAAATGHREIVAMLSRGKQPSRKPRSAKKPVATLEYRAQLAAFRSGRRPADREKARLERKWKRILGSHNLVVAEATGKKGRVFRVQTGPLDRARAKSLCRQLENAGQGCLVVRRAER